MSAINYEKQTGGALVYEYDGFKQGDKVVSTQAKPPATPRYIKHFIRFDNSVRVYFDVDKDAPTTKQSLFKINDWKYKPGLLEKVS